MHSRFAFRIVLVLFLRCAAMYAQLPKDFDLRANDVVFSAGRGALPEVQLFADPANDAIGVACVDHPRVEVLSRLALPDLSQRLERLRQGRLLRLADGRCSIDFPVFVGGRRRELQSVVDEAAARLAPRVMAMQQRLRAGVSKRPEIVFHILWSRVMDDAWDEAFRAAFRADGPPNAIWVVYPKQRFAVGTNSGGAPGYGSYALTWSDATRRRLHETSDAIVDAFRVAWNKTVAPSGAMRLRELGLLSAQNTQRVFAFQADDATDRLIADLRAQYATLAAAAYDYAALGKRFGVPRDQIFLILLHETAWAVFGRLASTHQLQVPAVLMGSGSPADTVQLLSLRLGPAPGPDADALYLFVKSGWRGNAETAAAFHHVVELHPDNLDAWLYLGFSLYELKDYRGAIGAFEQLSRRAVNDARMRDWGHVWAGHMDDLLGKREEALALYRQAAASDDKETTMFGQYDIGPITASEWARQRLETPFTRR
jgi:tetratricopeptide (TPR) repeat protein